MLSDLPDLAVSMKVTPTSFIEKLEASKEKPKGTVVANIKSQKKRIITAEKARERNKAVRSELKTAIKAVREAVEAKDAEKAQSAVRVASRLLDKAASKGIIHKNQARERKSGAQKLVNTLG